MVRLVKGAYWDTEIKRAQERGLDGYPVFTRKAMTDLNYVACAQKLLSLRPRIFPQFATHNALTVATVLELAGGDGGFEFQRLHGMGEALYEQLAKDHPEHRLPHLCPGRQPSRPARLSGAAAAGERRQLLLRGAGRRLSRAGCGAVAASGRCHRPAASSARHPKIPLPGDLFAPERRNSRGVEFGERARALDRSAAPTSKADEARRPSSRSTDATPDPRPNAAVTAARAGFAAWSRTPAATRAAALERAAHLLESRSAHFIALLQARGRQDAGRCAVGAARGRRLLPLLCRAGPKAVRRRCRHAGPDRREQCARACAGAASSSRSRPGIFRWRSSWARSRRR